MASKSSYIAQYPVLRTVQSTLHFTSLTDFFTQTPSQLLWETSSHMLQLMCEGCSYTYPLLSIARHSFIWLSELEQCRVKKLAQGFKNAAQDSNPGSQNRESEALPLSHCALEKCTSFFHKYISKQIRLKSTEPTHHQPPPSPFCVGRGTSAEDVESILLVRRTEEGRVVLAGQEQWVLRGLHLHGQCGHSRLDRSLEQGHLQQATVLKLPQHAHTPVGLQVDHCDKVGINYCIFYKKRNSVV